MRRSNRLVEWALVVLIVLIIAAVLFPVHGGSGPAPTTACISNLKQLGIGAVIYSDDNDGRAMPANDWAESIEPYVKAPNLYTCPLVARVSKSYGYAMNRFLGGVNIAKLKDPEQAHLFYDTTQLARNVSEYMPKFPIPGRHGGKNCVAYADSHVRAILMAAVDK